MLAFSALFVKKIQILPLSLVLLFFLVYFEQDGFYPPDYENYLEIFTNSISLDGWPYYTSITVASAEQLYMAFNGFVKFNISNSFTHFLVINGLLSLTFYYLCVKKMFLVNKNISFIMLLPVIYPTINYFLIRSAIPFFLGLWALTNLSNRKWLPAVVMFFIGINIHNQYILSFFLATIAFFYIKKGIDNQQTKKVNLVLLIATGVLTVILIFANIFEDFIAQVFSFLPNAELTSTKISYLTLDNQGFRPTSVLSILVFPTLSYRLLQYKFKDKSNTVFYPDADKDLLFIYLLFALSLSGLAINIGFIDNAHVAGRLSRFSDYACTLFIIHAYLRIFLKKDLYKLVILFIVIIGPIIYPAVYMDIEWGKLF